jgi:hypothetical protein
MKIRFLIRKALWDCHPEERSDEGSAFAPGDTKMQIPRFARDDNQWNCSWQYQAALVEVE